MNDGGKDLGPNPAWRVLPRGKVSTRADGAYWGNRLRDISEAKLKGVYISRMKTLRF